MKGNPQRLIFSNAIRFIKDEYRYRKNSTLMFCQCAHLCNTTVCYIHTEHTCPHALSALFVEDNFRI